ncbi:MAG: hypothetical protein K2X35_08880 [Bryobacteraceae bacterium]|nr:hypothetical protein [Bryobacteraceae bacterium]
MKFTLLAAFCAAAAAQTGSFDPKALKEDLSIAKAALEEGHPGVYRYSTKQQIDRAFAEAERKLIRPMSALEFYRVLAPAVAEVKCGHTNTGLPVEVEKDLRSRTKLAPFDIDIIGGKAYVIRDYSDRGIEGAELLSINGQKMPELLETMIAAASTDGESRIGRTGRVARAFVRMLPIIGGIEGPFQVAYRLKGQTQTGEWEGMTDGERAAAGKQKYASEVAPKPSATLEFPGDGKVAVMTIRSFGGFADLERKTPLNKFYEEAFAEIARRGAKALVLDVRGNGGGRDELGKLLFAHLTDKEFSYYDELRLNARTFSFAKYMERPVEVPEDRAKPRAGGGFQAVGHPNLGVQKPAQPSFAGTVIAIADRDSFSATGEFLTAFQIARRGRIVGEETSAGFTGNTSGPTAVVTLPNTKARVIIPLLGYHLAGTAGSKSKRGVMPDVPVGYTVEDRLAKRDPAMAKAMELAK